MPEKDSWMLPPDERLAIQDGRLRELVIHYYAPREPMLMGAIFRFLRYEKEYPLHLVHKILDRLAGMTVATTVMTHLECMEFIERLPDGYAIAKGPCPCRKHTGGLGPDARDLKAGKLEFCRETPREVDIQIAVSGKHFAELTSYKMISKQELLDLEEQCHNMGLVPNVYTMCSGESGICHCSAQSCVPFIANEAIGTKSAVIRHGRYISRVNPKRCKAHGDCAKVCHFHARRISGHRGRNISTLMAPALCYGCGYCAELCPEGAITMEERTTHE